MINHVEKQQILL